MPIEDVFSISGRGTVVTGRVEQGKINNNEEIEIVGLKPTMKTMVTGLEMFKKSLPFAQAGDNVGLLLRSIKRDQIHRGQVACFPGSIKPHTSFESSVYILTKEEGGRHTPVTSTYRPQFYINTADVTGSITLANNAEMAMPGDKTTLVVDLQHPIALKEGQRFAIREGGKTVGAGVVSKILK